MDTRTELAEALLEAGILDQAVTIILRSLADKAAGDDKWVSGHDMQVRIGALVTEAL